MNARRMCGHQIAPSTKAYPNCGARNPNIGDFRLKRVAAAVFNLVVAVLLFVVAAAAKSDGWEIGLSIAALIFAGASVERLYNSVTGKDR